MTTRHQLNDTPILVPSEDMFGISQFAKAIAKGVCKLDCPVGFTIALNGPWGSGKSSAINLIRHHLEAEIDYGTIDIVNFRCWWFRGEEALTLAFLQELHAVIKRSLGKSVKDLLPRIGKGILQAGPVIGPATNIATGGILGGLTQGTMDFAKTFFPDGDGVEKSFEELSSALEKSNKKLLVIIDDIDRLTPDESMLIFRLVKSVGRLPNVLYLLAFDRQLADRIFANEYPAEGSSFLDKIIQASFDIPLPDRDEIRSSTIAMVSSICGLPEERAQHVRFMNVLHDAVFPYITTPRDIARIGNALAMSWPPIRGEVNIEDFVSLETMRIFEPEIYREISRRKDAICGLRDQGNDSRTQAAKEITEILSKVQESKRERLRIALHRLFPRLEEIGYGQGHLSQWAKERRLCSPHHFETYFRMHVGDNLLRKSETKEILEICGNKHALKDYLRNASIRIRKSGKSFVPLVIDALDQHAADIEPSSVEPIISAIF